MHEFKIVLFMIIYNKFSPHSSKCATIEGNRFDISC